MPPREAGGEGEEEEEEEERSVLEVFYIILVSAQAQVQAQVQSMSIYPSGLNNLSTLTVAVSTVFPFSFAGRQVLSSRSQRKKATHIQTLRRIKRRRRRSRGSDDQAGFFHESLSVRCARDNVTHSILCYSSW